MELIRINDNKLKIMLTSRDMKNYALDAQALSCGTEETRRAFRSILHDAGVGSGFEEGKDKIYVQYYPSREGGCEMFVTRLSLPAIPDATLRQGILLPQSTAPQPMVYRFDRLSLLLHACHRLQAEPGKGACLASCAAYRDEEDRCYLTMTPAATPPSAQDSGSLAALCRLAGEFGVSLPYDTTLAYISEHATTLCPSRAIETLGGLC